MQFLPVSQLGPHIGDSDANFGILLPNVSPASGCSVELKVIHEDDQFMQAVAPRSFTLDHGSVPPWGDFWSLSIPLSDPFFARPGRYVYRYCIARTGAKPVDFIADPFAREFGVGTLSSFTLGYQPHTWSASEASWRTPELEDLAIYELNLAEFAHSLPQAISLLPYLSDLGITAVSLMPVTNVAASVDWGYQPMGYWGMDERFGRRHGFQSFVDAAHRNRIAVLVDAIYGHTSEDFAYEAAYKALGIANPFMGSFAEDDFGPSTDWNSNLVRAFFLSVNRHWLQVYHVDGFRYDCVPNYWDGPVGVGYAWLAYATHQHVKARVADGDPDYARFQPGGSGQLRLIQCAEQLKDVKSVLWKTYSTTAWQNSTLDAARATSVGAPGAVTSLGFAFAAEGLPTVVMHNGADVLGKASLQYIENHDHPRFVCQFGVQQRDSNPLFRYGDRNQWYKVQPYLIGVILAKGVPLLWQGQEFMENYWLPSDGRGRIAMLRPMRWDYFYDDIGQATVNLVRRVLAVRARHRHLRSGEFYFFNDPHRYQDQGLLLFARYQGDAYTLVALNFTGQARSAPFWFPVAGTFVEQLHGHQDPALNLKGVQALAQCQIQVPGNYGRVWTLEGDGQGTGCCSA